MKRGPDNPVCLSGEVVGQHAWTLIENGGGQVIARQCAKCLIVVEPLAHG